MMILIGSKGGAFCVCTELASLRSANSTANDKGLFLEMQGTLNSLELGLGKIIQCDNQQCECVLLPHHQSFHSQGGAIYLVTDVLHT
jgi:hypothetical protein